jgi:hypothetical protein
MLPVVTNSRVVVTTPSSFVSPSISISSSGEWSAFFGDDFRNPFPFDPRNDLFLSSPSAAGDLNFEGFLSLESD